MYRIKEKFTINKNIANNRKKIIYQYTFQDNTKGILVAEPDKRDSYKQFYKLYIYNLPEIVDQQTAKLDTIKNIQWISCIIEQTEYVYYLGNMLLQIEAQIEDGTFSTTMTPYINIRKTVQVVQDKYAENYWEIGKVLHNYHIKRTKSSTVPTYIQDNTLLEKLSYVDPYYQTNLYSMNTLVPDFELDSYPEDICLDVVEYIPSEEIDNKLNAGEYIWKNKE